MHTHKLSHMKNISSEKNNHSNNFIHLISHLCTSKHSVLLESQADIFDLHTLLKYSVGVLEQHRVASYHFKSLHIQK